MESTTAAVHVTTGVLASVDEVFRAWTDAGRLGRWLRPSPHHRVDHAAVDVRAGGGFEVRYAQPDVVLRGTWRELAPPHRLHFELARHQAGTAHVSQVAVRLRADGARTIVELQHTGLMPAEQDAVAAGWQYCFGLLIGECPRALEAYYANLERHPSFLSRFGGFWTDLTDGDARIAGKRALGLLDDADVDRLRHWREKGYVVLERAVPHSAIDALWQQLSQDWERGNPDVVVELCEGGGGFHRMVPSLRDRPHKVLNYHATCRVARDIQFAPPIRRFLGQLFERPPLAFQSLLFRYGTEQAMHQDTGYVVLRSPMEFVGCWIALEDVVEGSGELQYFEGSHRIPEYLWLGRARARPPGYTDDSEFLTWVRTQSERAGCPLVRFLPKKGDALLWHADLVHGGARRVRRELTRASLVSHFCPVDVEPEGVAHGRQSAPVEHAPGCHYSYPLY